MDPSFRVISSIQSQFIDEVNSRRKKITISLESLKSRIIEKVMIDQKLITQSKKALLSVSKVMSSQDNTVDGNSYFKKLKDANIDVPEDKVKEHFQLWSDLGAKCRAEYNELSSFKHSDSDKDREALRKSQDKFNNTYMTLFSITNIYDRFYPSLKMLRICKIKRIKYGRYLQIMKMKLTLTLMVLKLSI